MVDKTIEYVEIQKDVLHCIICLDICKNAVMSNCCSCLFCDPCSTGIKDSKAKQCPNCRLYDIQFEDCMPVRKIINTIKSTCPIEDCKKEMQREFLADHLKKEHEGDDIEALLDKLIIKDEKEPPTWGLFDIHHHQMNMFTSKQEYKCQSSRYIKTLGNCLRTIPPGANFYCCKDCREPFCVNCRNKKQVKFYVKTHPHGLELTFKDRGWTCDGHKNSAGCKSGNYTFSYTDQKLRYRCGQCDYDICGNCLQYYAFN